MSHVSLLLIFTPLLSGPDSVLVWRECGGACFWENPPCYIPRKSAVWYNTSRFVPSDGKKWRSRHSVPKEVLHCWPDKEAIHRERTVAGKCESPSFPVAALNSGFSFEVKKDSIGIQEFMALLTHLPELIVLVHRRELMYGYLMLDHPKAVDR
jgi:hypothetical protein